MQNLRLAALALLVHLLFDPQGVWAQQDAPDRSVRLWESIAPGETTESLGQALPTRPNENPPATRIKDITAPTIDVFEPTDDSRTGASVIICPGGGYNYVVVDKEGSEVARRLNQAGITAFVLRYRTRNQQESDSLWQRPLQDAQRAVRMIRHHAEDWELHPNQIGIMGFSAGGQVAALALTRFDKPAYPVTDDIDNHSCRPDFGLLIYPWRLVVDESSRLIPEIQVTRQTPPTFLVHTHDDSSTSLSSIAMYTDLKTQGVEGELHIYPTGGHGYGLRPVQGSRVHTWPNRAQAWLADHGWARAQDELPR